MFKAVSSPDIYLGLAIDGASCVGEQADRISGGHSHPLPRTEFQAIGLLQKMLLYPNHATIVEDDKLPDQLC
jgi:hypothetical protein